MNEPKVDAKTIQCISCDQDVKIFGDKGCGPEGLYPWMDGTVFESTGNFGSTRWDLEGTEYLQIVVCESCLDKKAKKAIHVVEYEPKKVIKHMTRRIDLDSYSKENKRGPYLPEGRL